MPPRNTFPSTTKSLKSRLKLPGMIRIPAGEFLMGTSDEQVEFLVQREEWAEEWYAQDLFLSEQPQHLVSLPEYELARYPVTNADYSLFTWETGYRLPRFWLGFTFSEEEVDHPVVGINRVDALAYCEWLSDKAGAQAGRSAYRLPTEAEWEQAARGSADDRIYPWGNTFDPWRCNTVESGKRGTSPVGSYSPGGDSPWGVNDLVGNVWEWTASTLRAYPYQPDDGRQNLDSPDVCVIRGGSWYYSRKLARCSAREGVLPNFVSPALGFRVARTP